MPDVFTFDYDEDNGEILFLSPIDGFDATVHEIYSIVIDNENEIEITTLNNGISISVPLFIEFYFPILEILRTVNHAISFTEEGIGIINKVREIVETEDVVRNPITEEDITSKLLDVGWNTIKRPISEFQMRNLLQTTMRDNAAIFSVPGAGKTVEALAYSSIVAGPKTLFFVVCPRNAYIAWEHELGECLGISSDEIIRCIGDDDQIRGKLLLKKKPYKAVLVNYNRLWMRYRSLSQYIQKMVNDGYKVVIIFDESHHFKGGSHSFV